MNNNFVLDKEILKRIEDSALFYPCSGKDLLSPIELFSPYIVDFWFVDISYFNGSTLSASNTNALLINDCRYKLLSVDIQGPHSWARKNKDIIPCTLTESYLHIESNKTIRVHRRRGYGFSAILNEDKIKDIGVFFYRGDSCGEGGSGNLWMKDAHLETVLNKFIEGGLLTIDGSDGSPGAKKKGIYKEFCKYTRNNNIVRSPKEIIESMSEVTDKQNRLYKCIGYAGMRYGPTMIWQVRNISTNKVV